MSCFEPFRFLYTFYSLLFDIYTVFVFVNFNLYRSCAYVYIIKNLYMQFEKYVNWHTIFLHSLKFSSNIEYSLNFKSHIIYTIFRFYTPSKVLEHNFDYQGESDIELNCRLP